MVKRQTDVRPTSDKLLFSMKEKLSCEFESEKANLLVYSVTESHTPLITIFINLWSPWPHIQGHQISFQVSPTMQWGQSKQGKHYCSGLNHPRNTVMIMLFKYAWTMNVYFLVQHEITKIINVGEMWKSILIKCESWIFCLVPHVQPSIISWWMVNWL